MRKTVLLLTAAVVLILAVSIPPWIIAHSREPEAVIVTNLPRVLPIEGKVTVRGTIEHSSTVRRVNLIVPPADRKDVTDLVQADDIVTDGFTGAVLSFHGEVRGTIGHVGDVGAILVPDETSVLEILREKSAFHFPLEVKVSLAEKVPEDIFSVQRRVDLGFPRYKVYLYNSTDRTVDVDFYVYMTQ